MAAFLPCRAALWQSSACAPGAMAMHSWYTAQELAGLPGMPGTDRNVRLLAERKGWQGQRRAGSKAIE